MSDQQPGGFAEQLVWWCKPCRSVQLGHCSQPEFCGFMQQIPYYEAAEMRDLPMTSEAALAARAAQVSPPIREENHD